MTLPPGARLGPYEIVSLLGVGGMGEVYQARDTRLDRTVAIKLLHAELAERPDRRARFEAEARAISSLTHPHICALFDVGEECDSTYLVMEYLDGETLDDRVTRGPLPIEELLRCAIEIADALEHAHDKRLVHRDVKPSNVMLTRSGAKLLDFGLATPPIDQSTALASTASFDALTVTAEGTMVGTCQYMAPEQLHGKAADARSDIFAFGAVLYEMATGRRAFGGESRASIIAAILTSQPPPIVSTRPARHEDTRVPWLDDVVSHCLAKEPEERWQTARELKRELEWIAKGHRSLPVASRTVTPRPRELVGWVAAAVSAIVAIALGALAWREPAREITRFVVAAPQGTSIPVAENRSRIAISPDGRRVAIAAFAGGMSRIWVRSLDAVDAQPIAGTDGAQSPFWSPDGRFIGFFSPGEGALKKIDVTGGPARLICAAQVDGAPVWGRDGTVLFTQYLDGIYRVSADGGSPVRVTRIDKGQRELNHYWPEFLPDGRHFLYLATRLEASGVRATPNVYVGAFDSPESGARARVQIAQMHSKMVYAAPGYLLFVQEGVLFAQRFDLSRLRLIGEPARVADGLAYFRTVGNGAFSVSATGVLAFQGAEAAARIVAYDRRGVATDTGWAQQNYGSIRFSRDGRRVAVDVVDPRFGTADVWVYDASRGAPIRLTSDLSDESAPVWSGDGLQLLIRMSRGEADSLRLGSAAPNLYAKTIATGAETLLVRDSSALQTEDWSPDGRWVAYTRNTRQTGTDIWLVAIAGSSPPQPFSNERFEEHGAVFSPDSRWLAFVSNESGASEVYVAPVGGGARTRLSVGGGTSPRWNANGRELFYAAASNRAIMSVAVQATGGTITAALPVRLFSIDPTPAAFSARRSMIYDVAPDGQRFLVSVPAGEASSSRVTVVLNWMSALPN